MTRVQWTIGVAVLCAVGMGGARADLIDAPSSFPDISSFDIFVQYQGGVLTAQGTPQSYVETTGGPTHSITANWSDFQLSANIDSSGNISGPGTLSILGMIGAPVNASSPLLTGSLVDFGFTTTGSDDVMDFIFSVTGGSLASAMGPRVYVLLNPTLGFTGSFAADWNNLNTSGLAFGTADTRHVVPAPSAAVLIVLGLGSLGAYFRRQTTND